MAEKYDRYGYALAPQNVSDTFWYYEEPRGLCCIFQPRDAAGNLLFHSPAWTIPWKFLEATMKRRVAAKRKRSKPKGETPKEARRAAKRSARAR